MHKNAFLLILFVALSDVAVPAGPALPIAKKGKAVVELHVSPTNSALIEHTRELAGYLQRITGTEFALASKPFEGEGILLALRDGATTISEADRKRLSSMNQEAYLLEIDPRRLLIVGNSERAVRHGVFDLLEQLGCRWLIPSERWTIVPRAPSLSVPPMHRFEEPAYRFRSIWYAYGMGGDESKEILARDYQLWFRANRLGGIASFQTGHSYPHTVGKHLAEFEKHPEFFAMDEHGKRLPPKQHQSLCYSNPDLARIFVQDRLEQLAEAKAKNPHEFMVSMDPNDGSVECHCEPCRALGNGSDQALHLANHVARALREKYPDAAVGLYVYASHRLPPEKIKAEPNVHVQVAMAFNKTQYTYEELVRLWRQSVTAIGIREYFGVMAWDWGLPGRGRGASPGYMKRMIPRFKEWGAVSLSAEINANWGAFGPATYVATKLLWDVKADADAVANDYFEKAFGSGAKPMKELYALWEGNQRLTQRNLHLWFGKLGEAVKATERDDEGVRQRIEDMTAYLHYVVLFRAWQQAEQSGDPERAYAALKPLLMFSWRTRDRQVQHSYALQRRLVNTGAPVLRPLREGWRFNEPEAVWKDSTPVTSAELRALFAKDVEAFPADPRSVEFTGNLALASQFTASHQYATVNKINVRGRARCFVVPTKTQSYRFRVVGRGTELELFDREADRSLRSVTLPTKETDSVELSLEAGHSYRLELNPTMGGGDATFEWPAELPLAFEASEDEPLWTDGGGPLYFLVPKGCKEVWCRGNPRLSLVTPAGKRIDVTPEMYKEGQDAAHITVNPGEDGKLWTVWNQTRGSISFLNVPPYLSALPGQMLLPREMLEQKVAK